MSNSTQTVNNTSKVQQGPVKTALKPGKESAVNFNALFADAMGQNNPKAQLSTFETQMREALGKQDEQKSREPEANPMAGEAAQSMVWAQRNWASQQTPDRSNSQPDVAISATRESQPSQPEANAKAPDQPSEPQSNAKPSTDSNKTSADSAQQPEQVAQQTPQTTEATAPESAPQVAASSSVINHAAMPPSTSVEPALSKGQGTALGKPDSTAVATTDVNRQATPLEMPTTPANGTSEIASQVTTRGEKPAEVLVSSAEINATANTRELPSQEKLNAINNPLAAQNVSTQLGQQRAAMVGNNAEQLEVQALKAGDQKLTTAGTGNPITGLATTLGNGPKAAAQTLIKTPVNQPGFARELGQTVNWALGRGMSTVDIRVNPESFGPMNMRLVQKGQQIQLVIRTQDEASANLMTQAIAGLKETLAQSGLNLQLVQVQHSQASQANAGNSGFQQSMEGSGNGQQSGSGSRSGQGSKIQRASDTLDESTAKAVGSRNTSQTGGIDLFA